MRGYFPLLAVSLVGVHAQTSVYLRASAPQAQVIIGCTNATPMVCQTYAAHGFSNSCNTTTNICYCNPTGVATGLGASAANGVRECVPTDSTHLALYDLSGNPVAGNGNWWTGFSTYPNVSNSAQWVSLLTKYTIPANAGPLGYLDGTNGDLMRRLSLSTVNGLAATHGVQVAGCPAACAITVNLSYNPTTVTYAVGAGQKFSITGTGTNLDTCGDGSGSSGAQSPYTVASVTISSWTSSAFTCSGLSNGDLTNVNLHCGPATTPNDAIGGTQSCTRVSQMAYSTNPIWANLVSATSNNHLTASPDYKTVYDGGLVIPGNGIHAIYGMAAIRFLVDPTNSLWLTEILYSLNNDFRTAGTGYPINRGAWVGQSDSEYNYTTDMEGLTLEYSVAAHAPEGRYWTASEMSAFLNRMYNDQDDPSGTACTQTNQDAGNTATHNWMLSSGNLATGTNDATHAQLPNTDPHYSTANYYVNTVIQLATGGGGNDYAHYTYGLITAQSGSGVVTVAGGWTGGGNAPTLTNMVGATYTSGLTCTGSTGQTFGLSAGNGGLLMFSLTGSNTIASGTAATEILLGGGYATPPTSGSVIGSFGSASCTGTATISATLGTSYTIFDTVITNNRGSGSATITWTKTASLSGSINPGDGVFGFNGWGANFSPSGLAVVTAVGTNSVTATNPGSSPYTSATPAMAWRIPQWTAGDCGRLWATKAQSSTSQGVQPAVYGPGGASLVLEASGYPADNIVNGGGSNPNAWPIFELATAGDDTRAVRDLGRTAGSLFDFGIRPLMDFSTGRLRDGPGYSTDEDAPVADLFLWGMTQTIPSYPRLDVTGPWGQNQAIWQMFSTLPDQEFGAAWISGWGGAGYGLYERDGLTGQGLVFSPSMSFAPFSSTTAYFRNWQEHLSAGGSYWGAVSDDRRGLAFLHNDPRIPSTSYTALPTQFAFDVSDSANVTALTGWPHYFRGDAVLSRTSWTSQTATLTLFDSATYTSSGVYDSPRVGQTSIWATGCLLGADSNPCNAMWGQDSSTLSDSIQFGSGGINSFNSGLPPANVGYTPITAWASANAGSAGTQFGDSQSRYAAACTSIVPNYNQSFLNITLDHANVCWAHHKNSGHDQFIFQFHDVALANSSATASLPMSWHLHYPQNGTPQSGVGGYTTGSTTYLGSNVIEEVEDGNGTPARTHGLLTYVTSPNTITVHDDCVGIGGGQCSGATYSGGQGYSHRFTVAGGAAVGANVSKFASVACHKVMSALSDTTFATFDINPDANWTGAGCTGANSTGIAIFAVNGIHNSMSGFTASFSGAADWTIVGLAPGIYNVAVGGSTVTGSPFTVAAGDTTIYFNTTGGGAVLVSQVGTCGSASSTCISGQVSTSGNVIMH